MCGYSVSLLLDESRELATPDPVNLVAAQLSNRRWRQTGSASKELDVQSGTLRKQPHKRLLRPSFSLSAPGSPSIIGAKPRECRTLCVRMFFLLKTTDYVAEREGFEPSRRLPAYTLSKRAPSATRPPLLHSRHAAVSTQI
jgi:hypothetical protein